MATGTYEPISVINPNGSQSSFTFSSIPQTYTDLILVINEMNNSYTANTQTQVGNGSVDTGNNYSSTFTYGFGSSTYADRQTNVNYLLTGATYAEGFGTHILQFMNYSNTNTYKTVLTRVGQANNGVGMLVGLWRSTSAIDKITLTCASGVPFTSTSQLSLYGIKAA